MLHRALIPRKKYTFLAASIYADDNIIVAFILMQLNTNIHEPIILILNDN